MNRQSKNRGLRSIRKATLALVALVATLPFFNIRFFELNLSFTLILLVLIIILASVNIVAYGNVKVPDKFAQMHMVFLLAALSSTLLFRQESADIALVKSFFYLAAYLAMIRLFSRESESGRINAVIFGAKVGIGLYFVLCVTALAYTGKFLAVLSDFSVQGFSIELYKSIDMLLMGEGDIESRDLRRNAMAEVFALFCLLPIIYMTNRNLSRGDLVFCCLSLFALLTTFSRRGLVAVGLILLAYAVLRRAGKKVMFAIAVGFAGVIYLTFTGLKSENRFVVTGENSRFIQYEEAFAGFLERPFFGFGYGAKVLEGYFSGGLYTHNYWIGYAYMLGIVGLILSVIVTIYILKYLFVPFRTRAQHYYLLLLIPLIGMAVGATVEGIYTPTAWLIFVLCFGGMNVRKKKRG